MSVVEVVHRNSLLNSKLHSVQLLSPRQILMSNNKKNKIVIFSVLAYYTNIHTAVYICKTAASVNSCICETAAIYVACTTCVYRILP